MSAPGFLIETGWREDLQTMVIWLFAAAIVAIIAEAFVFLTRPGSKLGDAFVPVMVAGICVFLGAGVALGIRVSETPMNEAYWKTYELQGRVLAADYASTSGNRLVPMALMDLPASSGAMAVNMSSNALSEYVTREVRLDCTLIQTENGAMDHLCTFAEVYQEASV